VRGAGTVNGTRGLVIAMLAAFIVGCSLGLAGGIVLARFVVLPRAHMLPRPLGPRHGGGQGTMLGRLERTLDLTPVQRDRVERILEESRRGYAMVRESTHTAIERELTPAQRDEWKQMEERFLRERRRGSGRPPWRGNRP
jgi:Spy/CpxP family protein refolding chaperone